eukprot:CAMPEP_0174711986 /NCGR_PEP_ID=MMETSP1094-20130205/13134_1 /TAXON_ID=156173 /ORGANISM="Chrysochromulina brevifilum, Strain UTEX LB 985" /LENGTH=137 /DNA_ID=CAMNT_0015910995 /DNA_START=220 /DNA_END=630 /DNA_ORIENTATION=-
MTHSSGKSRLNAQALGALLAFSFVSSSAPCAASRLTPWDEAESRAESGVVSSEDGMLASKLERMRPRMYSPAVMGSFFSERMSAALSACMKKAIECRDFGGQHSSAVGMRTRWRLESSRPSDQRESMSPILTAIPPA